MSRAWTAERRVAFSEVDEAVYLLDNEVEPWSIQLEVRVTGRLDEARLDAAVAEALARHPMARARKRHALPSAGSTGRSPRSPTSTRSGSSIVLTTTPWQRRAPTSRASRSHWWSPRRFVLASSTIPMATW